MWKRREGSRWSRGLALIPCSLCRFQQIQSNFIVVIHPGSTTLRLGRATDTLPAGIPHVIARRHKQPGQAAYRDSWLLRDGLNVSGPASPESPCPSPALRRFGLLCGAYAPFILHGFPEKSTSPVKLVFHPFKDCRCHMLKPVGLDQSGSAFYFICLQLTKPKELIG